MKLEKSCGTDLLTVVAPPNEELVELIKEIKKWKIKYK